jgi:hypothetical protein
MMSEHQIEVIVEHAYDRIDRMFINNEISQQEYMAECEGIRLWADAQLSTNIH